MAINALELDGDLVAAYRAGWAPPERLTVTEWADRDRYLSEADSAEHGKYHSSRTPYARGIMDALSPGSGLREVTFEGGAQVCKTVIGNNWIGYTACCSPTALLYVLPTLNLARNISKHRIQKMIDATPALRAAIAPARARDSGNTTFLKEFPGGILILTGANSAAGLRSMPAERIFLDDVDAYEGDVEGEGDPCALAEARTESFPRSLVYRASTPRRVGTSRIHAAFQAADRRRYFLPCPKCRAFDYVTWTLGGRFGNEGAHHHVVWGADPSTARIRCSSCGHDMSERERLLATAAGEWRATRPAADGPARPKAASFHLPGFYSVFRTIESRVEHYYKVKDRPAELQVFVNTILAEPWEDEGDAIEVAGLRSRRGRYFGPDAGPDARVPVGVGAMVLAVDVQKDRLECAVVGFGAGEESWLVDFQVIHGATEGRDGQPLPGVWQRLDALRATRYRHENGRELTIDATVVDSGFATEEVYRYCRARSRSSVFAVKGGHEKGKPLVGRPSNRNRYQLKLWVLCVDSGKELVLARLQQRRHGPGYVHLPEWIDDEFVLQLGSLRRERKHVKGRGVVYTFETSREDGSKRDEAVDLYVYALAGLHILWAPPVRVLEERAAEWARKPERPEEGPPAPASPFPMPRARRSWVRGR